MNSNIIDRRLPERSLLSFIYKDGKGGDIVVRLPFFENVKIREQKKARYETFKILARSSDLYAYLGADSRVFNLDFSMTLPHIQDHIRESYHRSQYITAPSLNHIPFLAPMWNSHGGYMNSKELFFLFTEAANKGLSASRQRSDYLTSTGIKDTVNNLLNSDWGRKGITPKEKKDLISRYGGGAILADLESKGHKTSTNSDPKFIELEKETRASIADKYGKSSSLIDTVMFWVNTVRSSMSTAGGSYNSGPPIIRLDHGVMYQSVPCICQSVSIESDEMAGYDMDTLLPRKIDVSMTLEEHRLGDFGKYSPSVFAKRDNLAGWEAVIKTGSMDPGRLL